MEIRINSLTEINDAAKQFIAAMGDSKVFAFYGKWVPERRLSSKPCAKLLGWRT